MIAHQRDMLDRILRNTSFDLGGDVTAQRPVLEQMLTSHPLPDDVRVTPGDLGGIPVIFVDIAGVEPRGAIFHIHGGGFALGSAEGSVGLASSLARKTGMRAVSVDYRLAPEHPYPAALQDVTAAYRALLEQVGSADHIVVSGESAGGNLAVELLIAGKAEGLTMPAAALLLSPMTDLTVTGSSYAGKAHADPVITAQAIRTPSRGLPGRRRPGRPPGQPHLRRPLRTAAAADPGGITRGAPRRCHPPRREGRSRRRGRHPGHHPRRPARLPGLRRPPGRGARSPRPGSPHSSRTTPLSRLPPDRHHQPQGNFAETGTRIEQRLIRVPVRRTRCCT